MEKKLEEKVNNIKDFFSEIVGRGDFLMVQWENYNKISVGFYDPVMSRTNLCLRSEALEKFELTTVTEELVRDGYIPCGTEINIPYDEIESFEIRYAEKYFKHPVKYKVTEEGIKEVK